MSGIVMSNPIAPGKVEAWRRFCQELAGARRQTYEASRRRLGITRERMALVETPSGSAAVTTIDARDVGQALGQIMTSDLPFDRWYRERIQELQGVNQASYDQLIERPPLPQDQELLFEWTSDPGSLGGPARGK
jgi:hypothetical protein